MIIVVPAYKLLNATITLYKVKWQLHYSEINSNFNEFVQIASVSTSEGDQHLPARQCNLLRDNHVNIARGAACTARLLTIIIRYPSIEH